MTTTHIHLTKLAISPKNARKTFSKTGIDEMQASILAHGLMQNLVVTEGDKGRYYVVAGARRLTAMNSLQKDGKLPKDHAVPCQIVGDEKAVELSLAENTVREAMHPLDEYEAFAKLIDAGATAGEVAIRFGKTEKHVLQRMKLARVAPAILKAYRNEELSLESLMAYTITDDKKRQAKAFKELQGWQQDNPREIRGRVTDKMIHSEDKLVKFVGVEMYEKAGGTIRADLFGDDAYLENSDLLRKLASDKLSVAVAKLQAEGWAWIETEDSQLEYRCTRLEPLEADVPPALVKQRVKLVKALQAIEEKYEAAEDDDEQQRLVDARDKAEADIEDIEEKFQEFKIFTYEQKAIAGCCLSITYAGKLDIEKGLVKPEDKKKMAKAEGDDSNAVSTADKPKMPESLRLDLQSYRQQIAMAEIALNPSIAFDLMAFTIAFNTLSPCCLGSGPSINFVTQYPTQKVRQDKTRASQILEKVRTELPAAWLEEATESARFSAFRELSREDKDRILAYCTALTLRPQLHIPGAFEDALTFTKASVAEYWRPSADNYLSRLRTDQLLEIGRSVAGDQWTQARKNTKKRELVTELDGIFLKSNHDDAKDAVKNWLPEGMNFAASQVLMKTDKKAA